MKQAAKVTLLMLPCSVVDLINSFLPLTSLASMSLTCTQLYHMVSARFCLRINLPAPAEAKLSVNPPINVNIDLDSDTSLFTSSLQLRQLNRTRLTSMVVRVEKVIDIDGD